VAGAVAEAGLAALLGYRLARASLRTDAVFEREVREPFDLRRVEFSALALVAANPGISPALLANELAISRPLITQCLDRLEGRGLLQRRPHASDGRGFALELTPPGRHMLDECQQRLERAEAQALACLSPGERFLLLELLDKVARRAAP